MSVAIRSQENKNNQNIIKTRDNDTVIINTAIKLVDDECNVMNKPTIRQRANVGIAFITATHQLNSIITRDGKHVQFISKPTISTYHQHNKTKMLTYDSGADGNYLSKKDRKKLGLPILRISGNKVGVANGGACNGNYVTTLPFPQLCKRAAEEYTFEEFRTSLMSVGKTYDDGNVSIFTKDGATVYKEKYLLITCQRKPILIGRRDEHGR